MEHVDHGEFPHNPNLDVGVAYRPEAEVKGVGIECKFVTDLFEQRHEDRRLRPAYLKRQDLWTALPKTRRLAEQVASDERRFKYLHAAQLLRHILGLKQAYDVQGFVLLYLWCDAPGEEAAIHRTEAQSFGEVVRQDSVAFRLTTYQEVILGLADRWRKDHEAYVDYLVERYL
jgi:hypothetical protein